MRLLSWLDRFRRSRALVVLLWVAILAGSAFRVREAFVHSPLEHIFSDPQRHWDHAREPLTPSPWAIIDPPLFQIWLSVAQKWSLGVPELVALYAGLLSAATPAVWYLFLREYLRSRTLALAGWAILVWLPSWIGIYSYFMTETLLLPLFGASLWQTMVADRKRTLSSFCLCAALWTLTGLTRGIGLALGGLAGLWVWLRRRDKVVPALAALAVVIALTAPFGVRNYDYMRLWWPFGTGWPVTIYAVSGKKDIHVDMRRDGARWHYEFGSPSMYAKQLAPLSDWTPQRTGVVSMSVDLKQGARGWKAAYDAAVLPFRDELRLRWENLVLVMLGQSWPDDNVEYVVARAQLGMRWIWAPLFVAVLIASAVRFRETRKRPLVVVLIVAWFFVQAVSLLSVNEGRYRKPLEGLLVVQVLVFFDRRALVAAPWRGATRSRLRLRPRPRRRPGLLRTARTRGRRIPLPRAWWARVRRLPCGCRRAAPARRTPLPS